MSEIHEYVPTHSEHSTEAERICNDAEPVVAAAEQEIAKAHSYPPETIKTSTSLSTEEGEATLQKCEHCKVSSTCFGCKRMVIGQRPPISWTEADYEDYVVLYCPHCKPPATPEPEEER